MPVRRCDDQSYTLASNLSATGSGVNVLGGEYMFSVDGTPVGSTLSLQTQLPNGTWCDVATKNGTVVKTTTLPFVMTGIDLPAGACRLAATGGTPTGLFAYLNGLG